MILLVGLGNIGKEYANNRHNVGFMIADELSNRIGVNFSQNKYMLCQVAKGTGFDLIKPETYINESGSAVEAVVKDRGVDTVNIWVVQDDTELPLGQVRVKFAGASGGHNGIKSIDTSLATQDYWRIKVGVGRPENPKYDLADYVLADFTNDEKKLLDSVIDQTAVYLLKCLKEEKIEAETFNVKQ